MRVKNLSIVISNIFAALVWIPNFQVLLDPHHDGYLFAQGVAVSQGKIPGLDVFTQYGIGQIYLSSIFFKLFGSNLANQRLLAILLNLLILNIIIVILNNYYKKFTVLLFSLFFILTAHFLYPGGGSNLFWPSTIFIFYTLLICLIVIKKESYDIQSLITLGILFYLQIITRPQYGIVALLLFCSFIFFKQIKIKIRQLVTILTVVLILFLLTSIYFLNMGALIYLKENIYDFPRYFYLDVFPTSFFDMMKFSISNFLIIGIIFLIINQFYEKFYRKYQDTKKIYKSNLVIIFLLYTFLFYFFFEFIKNRPQLNYSTLLIMMISIFLLIILILLKVNFTQNLNDFDKKSYYISIYIFMVTLINLYTGLDYQHLWLSCSGIIVSFAILFKLNFKNDLNLNLFLIYFICYSLISINPIQDMYKFVNTERFKEETILYNYEVNDLTKSLNSNLEFLKKEYLKQPKNEFLYLCPDGLISVLDGNYRSMDSMNVDWVWAFTPNVFNQRQKSFQKDPTIIICAQNKEVAINYLNNLPLDKKLDYKLINREELPPIVGPYFQYSIYIFDIRN